MPKRSMIHFKNVAKTRRKSILIDDTKQSSNSLDKEVIKKTEDDGIKHMRCIRTNQNNEIERLLLHNSKNLEFLVDHCHFPAFNVGLYPQGSNKDLINYPSVAFSTPYPLYVSNNRSEQIDLCFKRPMSSELYKRGLRHTRTAYQKTWKTNKALRNAAKKGIYHSSVFDLAERAFLQPDPFFHGSYDYYFTGGNIFALADNRNIIHAGGEKLRNMMLSTFPAGEGCADMSSLINLATHTTSESGEIFELSPLITSLDCSRHNCFIARQRNLISFNFLNEHNQIKTATQFRTKSTPFISFAQSDRDINKFIVTTMKQHIRLYDLNRSVPTLVKLFEISPKTPSISWNTTKPWRENTFLYANEKQFFLIDVRTSPSQWINEVSSAVDSAICDHISAILPSNFNNLFYVATNHKLHCMDVRHLKKFSLSDTEGALCRWSHQLLYAPLMIDSYRVRQTEYIALSSALPGDLHICQLNRVRNVEEISTNSAVHLHKHRYYSPCLPYQPPTLMEAYQTARLAGECLNPEANLGARIQSCTTGMSFLKSTESNTQSGVGLLLTSNSKGEVFAHALNKREKNVIEVRSNADTNEKMAEFERKLCRQIEPTLNYTLIKNMKSLRKVFLCKNLSSVTKYDFDAIDNEFNEDETLANNQSGAGANPTNIRTKRNNRRLRLGRWQKSLSTLYSYKDALVPDILSIWDIDIEEQKDMRLGNLHLNVKTDPEVKVQDWLDSNINSNLPMSTAPAQEVAEHDSNNVSFRCDNFNNVTETQNTTIDFENAVHSTQILVDNSVNISNTLDTSCPKIQIQNDTATAVAEKLKNRKKTKNYIKGF